jgi:hypothetical protein
MKFKVKEGVVDGEKFVKTVSERNEHEIVQSVKESVEEEWNRVELAQADERASKTLKFMLDNYKGSAE